MASKITEFVFGGICLLISYGIGKVDYFVFSMMADMLRMGVSLDTYNLIILIALLVLFVILIGMTILPLTCGIYLICDVFDIDISKKLGD